jgi:hypothetical protein
MTRPCRILANSVVTTSLARVGCESVKRISPTRSSPLTEAQRTATKSLIARNRSHDLKRAHRRHRTIGFNCRARSSPASHLCIRFWLSLTGAVKCFRHLDITSGGP